MARRGIFGRITGAIKRVLGGGKPPPSVPPRPPTPPIGGGGPPPIGEVRTLRRQAADRMLLSPLANRARIVKNVAAMSIDELRWTINATDEQLRNRARQAADRLRGMPDGGAIPLNPWWYR